MLKTEKLILQNFVLNFGYNYLSSPHIFLGDQEKFDEYYKRFR